MCLNPFLIIGDGKFAVPFDGGIKYTFFIYTILIA